MGTAAVSYSQLGCALTKQQGQEVVGPVPVAVAHKGEGLQRSLLHLAGERKGKCEQQQVGAIAAEVGGRPQVKKKQVGNGCIKRVLFWQATGDTQHATGDQQQATSSQQPAVPSPPPQSPRATHAAAHTAGSPRAQPAQGRQAGRQAAQWCQTGEPSSGASFRVRLSTAQSLARIPSKTRRPYRPHFIALRTAQCATL
jgi:hypothetical protein